MVGGDSLEDQFTALAQNPDILIVTPGRLLHHLQEVENFNMSLVQYVVFDEADRLFEQVGSLVAVSFRLSSEPLLSEAPFPFLPLTDLSRVSMSKSERS